MFSNYKGNMKEVKTHTTQSVLFYSLPFNLVIFQLLVFCIQKWLFIKSLREELTIIKRNTSSMQNCPYTRMMFSLNKMILELKKNCKILQENKF